MNLTRVSGKVFVSLPDTGKARASASVPGLKGRRFIPLEEAPGSRGSIVDTRAGKVRLTSARDSKGTSQAGVFEAGVFEILQSRRSAAKGLTELRLKGLSFRSCTARSPGKRADAAARNRRAIRRLRANARGRFQSRGRYSSATVRGTTWTVSDRCDGTLTKVASGKVVVRDLARHKTIVLKAGRSYLATPRR